MSLVYRGRQPLRLPRRTRRRRQDHRHERRRRPAHPGRLPRCRTRPVGACRPRPRRRDGCTGEDPRPVPARRLPRTRRPNPRPGRRGRHGRQLRLGPTRRCGRSARRAAKGHRRPATTDRTRASRATCSTYSSGPCPTPTSELHEVLRFVEPWEREASARLRLATTADDADRVLREYEGHGRVTYSPSPAGSAGRGTRRLARRPAGRQGRPAPRTFTRSGARPERPCPDHRTRRRPHRQGRDHHRRQRLGRRRCRDDPTQLLPADETPPANRSSTATAGRSPRLRRPDCESSEPKATRRCTSPAGT